jgi:undecaprenol kinase
MPRRLGKSFHFAFRGISHAVSSQQNFRIHVFSAIIVALFAWKFSVSLQEWIALIMVIGFVLVTETINTAIEESVNLACQTKNPLAEKAKDTAAAAVLMAAICAIITGVLILVPYFLRMLK